jgi:hypothetical protein
VLLFDLGDKAKPKNSQLLVVDYFNFNVILKKYTTKEIFMTVLKRMMKKSWTTFVLRNVAPGRDKRKPITTVSPYGEHEDLLGI